MSTDRIARIRESEKKSHTEIYSNEKSCFYPCTNNEECG